MEPAEERIAQVAGVTLERVGEEGVLHDPRSGKVHVINASAVRVWELCATRPTAEELARGLAASYGLDAGAVRGDVEEVLRELRAQGLVDAV